MESGGATLLGGHGNGWLNEKRSFTSWGLSKPI